MTFLATGREGAGTPGVGSSSSGPAGGEGDLGGIEGDLGGGRVVVGEREGAFDGSGIAGVVGEGLSARVGGKGEVPP